MIEAKNWLIHGRQTDADVMNNWNISFRLREREFKAEQSIEKLLSQWPILKTSIGKILVIYFFLLLLINTHLIFVNRLMLILKTFSPVNPITYFKTDQLFTPDFYLTSKKI